MMRSFLRDWSRHMSGFRHSRFVSRGGEGVVGIYDFDMTCGIMYVGAPAVRA